MGRSGAIGGISQTLPREVAPFGIKLTLIEPSGFSTDGGGPSAGHATPNPAYEPMREAMRERRRNMAAGNPEATGPVVLDLVDMANPPLRVFFGADPSASRSGTTKAASPSGTPTRI